MYFLKHRRGSVSIFLVIILVPMLTISALFVDVSKVSLSRGAAASALDLSLNTALTNYDTELKDLYGLFATAQDMDDLFNKLEDYYRTCITSAGVSDEDAQTYTDQIMAQLGMLAEEDETADILSMELMDFDVSKYENGSLANATILEKQIVDFMKYRAPINTGLSFLSALQSFTALKEQTDLVEKRKAYYETQSTVMQAAYDAWTHIAHYNEAGFAQDTKYFETMESKFANYSTDYTDAAEKTITDLYDTNGYDTFNPYLYSIVDGTVTFQVEVVEENEMGSDADEEPQAGLKKQWEERVEPTLIFYTNKDLTSKRKTFNEYLEFSMTLRPTVSELENALTNYYNACQTYFQLEPNLMEYGDTTDPVQFLVQTQRDKDYTNWVNAMCSLYDAFSKMMHVYYFADEKVRGATAQLFGETSEKALSAYYDQFYDQYATMATDFTKAISGYNSKLDSYDSQIHAANPKMTDSSAVNSMLVLFYGETTSYRETVYNAKIELDDALTCLGNVYDGVKAGGTLDVAKDSWSTAANGDKVKNTSMAKQDKGEIESLHTYLKPEYVQALIDRLSNIRDGLQNVLDEIDSYTFFGTPITEIADYASLESLLKNNIGHNVLTNVPVTEPELTQEAERLCQNKFVVGKKIDTSWSTQSQSRAILSGQDQLNFYSYLYTKFHDGTSSTFAGSTVKEPNKEEGEDAVENIKKSSSDKASNSANSDASSSISTNNSIEATYSKGSSTPSGNIDTGEDAASKASTNLGGMLGSLTSALLNLGTDLRDKLYVSDYILSMFSYATIENENKVKNGGTLKKEELITLTLTPIDAANNYAYGREVEYIIYGGTNSENLTKAYGSIFAIRLAFNLIYAFMSSEVRDTALALATPISAATLGIIPVPLIQAIIIIGAACCESGLDLQELKNGEKIPLFKSKDSWRTSIGGLVGMAEEKAKEVLKEVAGEAVDLGAQKLGELLDKTDEELEQMISNGEDEISGYVGEAYDDLIKRHAETAIQKLSTLVNNAIEQQMIEPNTDMVEYVSSGLDDWLAQEKAAGDPSSIEITIKEEAVKIIKDSFIQPYIEAVKNVGNDASATVDQYGTTILSKIDEIKGQILGKINQAGGKIQEYRGKMMEKVRNSMKDGAESLKNTINEELDGIMGGGSSASGAISGDANDTGVASLLSFSYSDYLRLFLMIGLYSDEEGVLLRTADAIRSNMILKTGNTGYDLKNSAVYVKATATVQVKPTLLALPLFADVENNPKDDTGWYTLTLEDVRGY